MTPFLRVVIILFSLGFVADYLQRLARKSFLSQHFFRKLDIFSVLLNIFILVGSSMKALDLLKTNCNAETDTWITVNEVNLVNSSCQCPDKTLKEMDVLPLHCQLEACFRGVGETSGQLFQKREKFLIIFFKTFAVYS